MEETKFRLKKLINEGKNVLSTKYNPYSFENPMMPFPKHVNEYKFSKWRIKTINYLYEILKQDDIRLIKFEEEVISNTCSETINGISIIEAIIDDIEEGTFILKEENEITYKLRILEYILKNFHAVARQLKDRRENRATLEIKDEYDVQDLLRSLLHIYFEDIRPEEYTPSYAGGSSRMDFLIKDISTVIETKMTRSNLKDKELGEELIIDMKKYSKHQDCKKLYCFIYDPQEYIKNPKALEMDLTENFEGIQIKTIIVPKY